MTAGQRRRLQLFDACAANLAAVPRFCSAIPVFKDVFICPTCKDGFLRESLDANPAVLTIEDCIPKKLGGTKVTTTLQCAECNNTAGSKLDAQIRNRIHFEEFFEGTSSAPTRVTLELGAAKATADWFNGKSDTPSMKLAIDGRRSFTEHVNTIANSMDSFVKARGQVEMKLSFKPGFKKRESNIALLRIGFLMMFRQFGYSYILNPCVARVRQQIRESHKEIVPDSFAVLLTEQPMLRNGVAIVTGPSDYHSFMVVVRLKTKKHSHWRWRGIIMPGIHQGADEIYEFLDQDRKSKVAFRGTLSFLPFDERWFHDPEYPNFPYELWHNVTGKTLGTCPP